MDTFSIREEKPQEIGTSESTRTKDTQPRKEANKDFMRELGEIYYLR
ncbi:MULTISPECIES: hypothetical protein [Enterococcus]|nr:MULTISPECIES: hypothetical protein [Enterococcus]